MTHRLAIVCLVVFASVDMLRSAGAQVIYEPVRYQYGCGRNVFYYGGTDPSVIRRGLWACGGDSLVYGRPVDAGSINTDCDCGPGFYKASKYERDFFEGGGPVRVFSDAFPRRNASLLGFTPSDARNEANANVPQYYRKADLMQIAHVDSTGAVIVPAAPIRDEDTQRIRYADPVMVARGGIVIRPWHGGLAGARHLGGATTTTSPSTLPTASHKSPVIIIPKDLLNRPLSSFQKRSVASAAE